MPASAATADLRQLAIGSEGVFGVITRCGCPGAPDFRIDALRGVVVSRFRDRGCGAAHCPTGTGPTVVRLSGERPETGVNLATTEAIEAQSPAAVWGSPCSNPGYTEAKARRDARVAAASGTSLGEGPARAWERQFAAPYRIPVGRGSALRTLETAVNTPVLKVSRKRSPSPAASGTPALVMMPRVARVSGACSSRFHRCRRAAGDPASSGWPPRRRRRMRHGHRRNDHTTMRLVPTTAPGYARRWVIWA